MGRAGELTAARSWVSRAGPLLVLPAIFLFAYAVAWRLSSPRDPLPAGAGELSNATSHGAPEDVGGFLGRLEVDGGVLHARLLPLQSAADWQAFDAQAIARRLGEEVPRGEPVGEPWRLELSFEAPKDAAPLVLGTLVVESEGARLAQLTAAPADEARATDPLRTLLARRANALQPGTSIELVLLGRPPRDTARLEVQRPAADGGPLTLALLPGRVRTAELARSIARAPAEDEGGDAVREAR